jgi:hypothetical protein
VSMAVSDGWAHTDLDIGALVVGNARVGCAFGEKLAGHCGVNFNIRVCAPRSMPMAPS